MAFRILSLSGGGYMGLYTAAVLAGLEEQCDEGLHKKFDLIAGTSIGGILALGISSGVSASKMLAAFRENGEKIFSSQPAPTGWLKPKLELRKNALGAKYSSDTLRATISDLVGKDVFIGDLKQRTVIPAVNLTKGSPQVFKTPHHSNFVRDWKIPVVDVALATSAAPTFFPAHKIGGEMFADGGLYANSPDDIALHEAEHFLKQQRQDIYLLSIGTTTASFSFSSTVGPNLGWVGWMDSQRLPSAMIGAQQKNCDFMMRHRLGDRYIRIDREQSAEQARHLALDVATKAAIENLEGLAEASLREHLPSAELRSFLDHIAPEQDFLRGKEIH
ncbi:MAG: patatin-like phospholipase family protein [Roseicyclus sp.]|nr:patatin-like phospholipase family protein [Roseicyclus sp.]MBO6923936.1 patatin-like phospholipase family protein [Roseicyclus sp.]